MSILGSQRWRRISSTLHRLLRRLFLAWYHFVSSSYGAFSLGLVLFFVYFLYLKFHLSTGVILGVDWTFPATPSQVGQSFVNSLHAWANMGLFGSRVSSHNAVWFSLLLTGLSRYIPVRLLPIVFIVTSQLLIYLATFVFLYEVGSSNAIFSLIGALIASFHPFVFDSICMGWLYLVFALGFTIISLVFIAFALRGNFIWALWAGVFYGLAFAQSQALLWVPLLVVPYVLFLVDVSYKRKALVLLGFFLSALLVAVPSSLDLFRFPDQVLLSPRILFSSGSLGAMAHVVPANTIRGLGSIFNFQYESALPLVGHLVLFLMVSSLIFLLKHAACSGKISRLVLVYFLIYLVPSFVAILGYSQRALLSIVPYSAIFRDIGRFGFLLVLPWAYLLAYALTFYFDNKSLRKWGILLLIFTFILGLPWLNGSLLAGDFRMASDIRLHTLQYSGDYELAETFLNQLPLDILSQSRVLYLPLGFNAESLEDTQYIGAYHEFVDPFATFSPMPGKLAFSDKSISPTDIFLRDHFVPLVKIPSPELLDILENTSVRFVAIRHDLRCAYCPFLDTFFRDQVATGRVYIFLDLPDITIFELPHAKPRVLLNVADSRIVRLNPARYDISFTAPLDSDLEITFTDVHDLYWRFCYISKPLEISPECLSPNEITFNPYNEFGSRWKVPVSVLCSKFGQSCSISDGVVEGSFSLYYLPESSVLLGYALTGVYLGLLSLVTCLIGVFWFVRRVRR